VTDAARYVKLVEWSDEDQAFVGQCPGIIYRQLCGIVEEWIEIFRRDGRPLPRRPPARASRRRSPNRQLQRTPAAAFGFRSYQG